MESPQETCAGCLALSQRVERLEQALGTVIATARPPVLNTTFCYWIIIALHSLLLSLMLCGIDALSLIIYPFLVGSVGSLAVCHALANRSVAHKFARSLLSACVVCGVASVPLITQMGSTFNELFEAMLIYIPLTFGCAWLAAKLFASARGWLILPPGVGAARIPFKISDILIVTLIAAVYFTAARALLDAEVLDFADADTLAMLGVIGLVSLVGGVMAACVARGCLTTRPRVQLRWIVGACALAAGGMIGVLGYYYFEAGDAIIFLFYATACSLACVVSPAITFLLMRTANYRLGMPGEIQSFDPWKAPFLGIEPNSQLNGADRLNHPK